MCDFRFIINRKKHTKRFVNTIKNDGARALKKKSATNKKKRQRKNKIQEVKTQKVNDSIGFD